MDFRFAVIHALSLDHALVSELGFLHASYSSVQDQARLFVEVWLEALLITDKIACVVKQRFYQIEIYLRYVQGLFPNQVCLYCSRFGWRFPETTFVLFPTYRPAIRVVNSVYVFEISDLDS